MADDLPFSVLIDELARDGIRLSEAGDVSVGISTRIDAALAEYPRIGGSGTIGESINKKYYSAAEIAARFAGQLADLLDVHSGKTAALAGLFSDVNETATNEATGLGRKG
jgi:hypothetical protein